MRKPRKSDVIIGQEFGKLTVKGLLEYSVDHQGPKPLLILCQCICGNVVTVRQAHLKTGGTRSCGCLKSESAIKRVWGDLDRLESSYKSEYQAFKGMFNRCYSEKDDSFEHYGARGIIVEDIWQGSDGFKEFMSALGPKPKGFLLDRIDPNKNYCPENCRWVDLITSQFNKTKQVNNASGRTGINWDQVRCKWKVYIARKHLGYYESFEEACRIRESAELELYGQTKE